MNRLRPFDRALVLVLTPLWVVFFCLTLVAVVRGSWHPPFQVERTADYPAVTSLRVYAEPDAVPMRPGDRIVRIAEVDLRGLGSLGLMGHFMEAANRDGTVRITLDRSGKRVEVVVAAFSNALF